VVFMAPTRPLVSQQMGACRSFMGMPRDALVEITGGAKAEARKDLWTSSARAFFCTPQALWNDVRRGICPYERIVCLVIDECHRATGANEAAQVVGFLVKKRLKFRVLGLSATPGSSRQQIQVGLLVVFLAG
jgi:ERCC4-related helicase